MALSVALAVLALTATAVDAWVLERDCPMHRLGRVNALLGVTAGRPEQRPSLAADLTVARHTFMGCSVLDGSTAKRVMPKVNLRLYYGSELEDYVAATVGSASSLFDDPRFNKSRCIAVYAFGYTSTPDNEYTRDAITALVSTGQYNVLLVDWSAANNLNYELSVDLIDRVASAVAVDLERMQERGARLCLVAGHSLGGQMTGSISRHLQRMGKAVPCAVALDPAAPLFEGGYFGCAQPISEKDADWVIVMHTDICGLGSNVSRGDVDFFPNHGLHGQPSCSADTYDKLGSPQGACSHVLAVSLFAEALRSGGALPGRQCSSWEAFEGGDCDARPVIRFPDCSERRYSGFFYMTTSAEDPLHSTNPPAV